MPDYLQNYCGGSRLRSCHLDESCFVSNIIPKGNTGTETKRGFYHSFFYRSHLMWNILPKGLRETSRPSHFKIQLLEFLWNDLIDINNLSNSDFSEDEVNDRVH